MHGVQARRRSRRFDVGELFLRVTLRRDHTRLAVMATATAVVYGCRVDLRLHHPGRTPDADGQELQADERTEDSGGQSREDVYLRVNAQLVSDCSEAVGLYCSCSNLSYGLPVTV